MAKITQEQYYISDLKWKEKLLKQLTTMNYILTYKFGPYDPELQPKLEEEIKNGIKSSGIKIGNEN